jgi:hypothetical protein
MDPSGTATVTSSNALERPNERVTWWSSIAFVMTGPVRFRRSSDGVRWRRSRERWLPAGEKLTRAGGDEHPDSALLIKGT